MRAASTAVAVSEPRPHALPPTVNPRAPVLHETLPALFLAGDGGGSPRWLHPVYRCGVVPVRETMDTDTAYSKLRVLNDLLDGTHFLAYIEAMSLGVRPGIHPSIVYGIISNAAGRTFVDLVPKLPSGDPLLIDFLNSSTKKCTWLKNENTDANLKRAYLISKMFDLHEGMRFGFHPYAANNELTRYKQR